MQQQGSTSPTFNRPKLHASISHQSSVLSSTSNTTTARRRFVRRSSVQRFDDSLLHRATADAGRWAYGIIAVEVWVLNEEKTLLSRPESGWWIDPVYHRNCGPNCQICRLTNEERDDFVPPQPLAPGVGLPGCLWSAARNTGLKSAQRPAVRATGRNAIRATAARWMAGLELNETEYPDAYAPIKVHQQRQVAWREIQPLAQDHDQPWNERLHILAALGLGWACGIPFNLHSRQGIVVYMARQGVDLERLQSETNEAYLVAASDLIAAAYALRGPRRQVIFERRYELKDVMRRVRRRIAAAVRENKTLQDVIDENQRASMRKQQEDDAVKRSRLLSIRQRASYLAGWMKHKITSTALKCRGAAVKPPPVFTWTQTAWTFVGVFVTLLMVTRTSSTIGETLGPDWTMVLGPFGAFVTLAFGLTAAPASQPRNTILGQIASMSISIGISYTSRRGVPLWFRQSLATALAVSFMVKFGLTHPPAGAAALLFSSGKYGWGNVVFNLVGNVIAILAAAVINNSNEQRQYPTFWGFGYLGHMIFHESKQVISQTTTPGFTWFRNILRRASSSVTSPEEEEVKVSFTPQERTGVGGNAENAQAEEGTIHAEIDTALKGIAQNHARDAAEEGTHKDRGVGEHGQDNSTDLAHATIAQVLQYRSPSVEELGKETFS